MSSLDVPSLPLGHLHRQVVNIHLQSSVLGRELVDVDLHAMHARYEG